VTGEVPAVGVTGPPDFLVKRLLKKLANAPSFAAVLLPPGVTVLKQIIFIVFMKNYTSIDITGWFLGRPGIDGVCEPMPVLTPDVTFRVCTGVAFSSWKSKLI
jgi:hypothetical protein